jgi:gamma-resorcylate decarboxylase
MQNKIALEEHFATPETLGDSERYFPPAVWQRMYSALTDIHEKRLAEMDLHGIQTMLLSLNSPAIQAIYDTRQAIEVSCRTNDFLAEQVTRNPSRFQAFAALPMQDPAAAARELTRCVRDLGFKGALVNGFSQVGVEDSAVYYDLPQYEDFWATVEQLGVPFYLHPRDPLFSRQQHYEGHPWFVGPVWAFAVETSIHALRLMASGLFDRHPKLTIILGHLGEGITFNIWRADHRLKKDSRGMPAQRPLGDYFRENFFLTTSGNFRTPSLENAIAEIGVDRILFSADYPFENIADAANWFDKCAISDADREKIGHRNAARLFGLQRR